jgi:hypothetical protein
MEVDEQPSNPTTPTTTPTKSKAKPSIAPKTTPAQATAKSSTVTPKKAKAKSSAGTPKMPTPKWIAKEEKQYAKNIEEWNDAKYAAACATAKQEAINDGSFVPTAPDYGIFVKALPREKPGYVAGYLHLRDVWETREIIFHPNVEDHFNRAALFMKVSMMNS